MRVRCKIDGMLSRFELHHDEHGAVSAVTVTGELDLSVAPEFRNLVRELMGRGIRVLTVDLTDTDFIDSSGLGALLWAEHRLQAVGGDLGVIHAHGTVERSFRLAGLDAMLVG
jgi:anti-sigma B factor antagonist